MTGRYIDTIREDAYAHTQGPWNMDTQQNGDGSDPCYIITAMDPTRRRVASLPIFPGDYGTGSEPRANARLIAAAPQLLDALGDTEVWLNAMASLNDLPPSGQNLLRIVRRALYFVPPCASLV